MASENSPNQGSQSRVHRTAFKVLFWFAPHNLVEPINRRVGFLPYVELRIPGRRSGVERRTMVTLIQLDGNWYVGHPNGESHWVRNLQAAESALVVHRDGSTTVRAIELEPGEEREKVIKATAHQLPPAGVVYYFGRSHIRATGSYFRLERDEPTEVLARE